MNRVIIHDRSFIPYISAETIKTRIVEMAKELSAQYADKQPLFVSILNGSFIFAADLVRELSGNCEISFVKIKSYQGMESTGSGKVLVGLEGNIKDRHIIVLEDIIDSGNTIQQILPQIDALQPKSVEVATLLFKPDAMKFDYKPDYVGFTIDNKFIVGYGLDYSEQGRHLKDLYILEEGR